MASKDPANEGFGAKECLAGSALAASLSHVVDSSIRLPLSLILDASLIEGLARSSYDRASSKENRRRSSPVSLAIDPSLHIGFTHANEGLFTPGHVESHHILCL